MNRFITTLLLTLLSVCSVPMAASGQVSIVAEESGASMDSSRLQEIERYRIQLQELESEFGQYHNNLLEPLASIVSLQRENGDYEAVAKILDRQLQVMRAVRGLQHLDTIPILRDIVRNQIQLGNWAEVSDHLAHVSSIHQGNGDDPLAQLQALDDQASWYLNRINLDDSGRRARNFFAARELFEEMERLSVDSFGEDSPQNYPWFYKKAINKYQLVELLNSSGGLSSRAIRLLIREDGQSKLQSFSSGRASLYDPFGRRNQIPVVDAGKPIGEAYLRDGTNLIRKIGEIAEKEGDIETQAMAELYEGDFQLLAGIGLAFRHYRTARDLLLQAGIDQQHLEQFFNRPAVIPVDTFFRRFDELIAYQQSQSIEFTSLVEESVHIGVFTAWSESLPSTGLPTFAAVTPLQTTSLDPREILNMNYNRVDLSFNLSSRGRASSIDVLAAVPDERRVQRKAIRAIRGIHFRPRIVEGKNKRMKDVQIQYQFLQEQD